MEKTGKKQKLYKEKSVRSDWNIRPYLAIGLVFFLVFCCCTFVICVLFRFEDLKGVFNALFRISQPILFGLVIGYLINPIMMIFERGLLKLAGSKGEKDKFCKAARTISSILAVLVFVLFIALLISMILPQMIENVTNLVYTLPAQVNSLIENMNQWEFGNHKIMLMLENYLTKAFEMMQDWLTNTLLQQTKEYAASITNGVISVLVAFKNIVIGLIVSIYVMCEKESFVGQGKKIIFALLPSRAANQVVQIFHTSNVVFGGFIKGKLLDSLIIGIICYIGLTIIKMPYTLLVSVIVGVTNVIPFFGPFIGAIPCTLLILLVDPLYSLYFVIFVLVLQQVDGNIIGPKILGDSTGLSSFWVMFAILVGSGMLGVVGMVIGCPIFAVIYYMVRKLIHFLLRKKDMPVETDVYIEATGVEPGKNELWYGKFVDEREDVQGKIRPEPQKMDEK